MDKPKAVLENETHSRDFEMQTDHLIKPNRLAIHVINSKKIICPIVDFAVPSNQNDKFKKDKIFVK